MKSYLSFLKKEWMERLRGGHVIILGIVFLLFGIMSPAIAKLTPWMMELFSETLAQSGMTVSEVTVDAMSSWTQFYKNIPIALIVFVFLTCGTLTSECQKGTLIPVLTKGLHRDVVLSAKQVMLTLLWTGGFWLCYGVTFAYNAFFWDNSIALHLSLAAGAYYLYGLWIISLILLFSSFCADNTGVLLGTGGACVLAYALSMLAPVAPYTPTHLTDGMQLLTGSLAPAKLLASTLLTAGWILLNGILAAQLFHKRKL